MEHEEKYQLVIWFNPKQAGIDDLFRFVNSGVTANVEKRVGYSTEGYLELSLSGDLVDIDTGHSQIIEFIERIGWNHFRIIDTAGDEIRQQAYSELSNIEQELRAFINRGLIEAFGFDWWSSLGALKIPGLENPEYQKTHHRLELMTIEELIDFVTFEKSELSDEDPISLKDLSNILDRSTSFEEFRANLAQKTKKISLWELVFSKYLGENAPLWQEIKRRDLQFIIELRNKVMHHRPVHLGELRALDEKRRKVSSLIASAKTHLSEEEKKDISTLQKKVRDIFAQLVYERTGQNTYNRLYGSLKQSRNIATIQNLNNEIAGLTLSGSLSTKESLELKAVAFEQLETLTNFNLELTQEILLNELLPLCLQEEPDLRMQSQAFRNILADWINDHSEKDALSLKNLVLDNLAGLIGTMRHKTTCWTISRLGLARGDIVQQLFDYGISNDDEVGDDTLSTLTWLNFSPEQRFTILGELHRRMVKRYNNSLVWSLARLADPTSVSIIFDEWLQADKIAEKNVDASLAFTVLREIADANENDIPLQDEIWQRASELVENNFSDLYFAFDIGHLVTACNSSLVLPTLLCWHGQHPDWFQKPGWARYLAQERLGSTTKPLQLEGWSQIGDKRIFDYLRNDACSNTNDDNFYTTQEALIKESAWKTVLRAAYADSLTWFDPAVSNENGRFIRKKTMEYLAAFKIDPLPETVTHWITQEYNDLTGSDGRELSYRMAAVRLAQSLASQEAFDALVNFGYTNDGKVLQQSADAVVSVTLSLLRQDHIEIVDRLAKLVIEDATKRQRLVSINALEFVASFPEYHPLLLPYREHFIALLYKDDLENIERGQLLNIISSLPGDISEAFEKELVKWALDPDRWISVGGLQALAWHGLLENNSGLMRKLLGLEKDGELWRLVEGEHQIEWAPYIMGILYHNNIKAYTNAVNTWIIAKDWRATIPLIKWLESTDCGAGKPQLPIEIVNGLLERLTKKLSGSYSESEIFEVLAKLAPDALVNEKLVEAIPNWMPDSNIALANALLKANISPELKGRCLAILESQTEDSLYSVRRSAYRALARHSAIHLYGLCKSWSDSPVLKLNLRAAEACGWIENVTIDGQDGFQELKALASSHLESGVREALKRSWEERRRRRWAKIYLEKVISVEGRDNYEVLQAWRYGDALCQIGDDEIREMLRDHLLSKQLPPNVRFWITKHILDNLENNWKKVTQKWPEPWVDSRGAIQRGNGKLMADSDKSIDVQYSMWFSPAATPAEKHSWGGNLIIFWGEVLNIDQAVLELEDGRKAEILLGSITGNTTTFLGKGYYPS